MPARWQPEGDGGSAAGRERVAGGLPPGTPDSRARADRRIDRHITNGAPGGVIPVARRDRPFQANSAGFTHDLYIGSADLLQSGANDGPPGVPEFDCNAELTYTGRRPSGCSTPARLVTTTRWRRPDGRCGWRLGLAGAVRLAAPRQHRQSYLDPSPGAVVVTRDGAARTRPAGAPPGAAKRRAALVSLTPTAAWAFWRAVRFLFIIFMLGYCPDWFTYTVRHDDLGTTSSARSTPAPRTRTCPAWQRPAPSCRGTSPDQAALLAQRSGGGTISRREPVYVGGRGADGTPPRTPTHGTRIELRGRFGADRRRRHRG